MAMQSSLMKSQFLAILIFPNWQDLNLGDHSNRKFPEIETEKSLSFCKKWNQCHYATLSLTISVGDIYRRSIFLPFIDEIYDICRRHLSSINLQFSSVWDAERREKKYSSCLRGRDLWIILWYFAIYCRSIDYICWKSSYIIDKSHGATFIHVSCIMYHVSCIMYHVSCIMYHVSCIIWHFMSFDI